MILAMPESVETLLGLHELKSHVYSETISKEQLKPEEFNLFKMADPELVAGFRELYSSKAVLKEIATKSGPVLVAQGVIPETGWRTFVVTRQSKVFEAVNQLARLSRMIGYAAVAVLLAFYIGFFIFLRDRARRMAAEISRPVEKLTQATTEIGTGLADAQIPASGIEEIDRLTENFNTMSAELTQRSRQLVEARVRSEMKEKEAELAYTRGLYESASGYLHNVGNAITRMESHLLDMETVMKSTAQYPEVFQKLEAGGQESVETLGRFKEILLQKTVPLLKATFSGITRIKDSIIQTISHQQSGFLAAARQASEKFPLSDMLAELCAQSRRKDIVIETRIDPDIWIQGHREPVRQGIENVIKNAVEAMKKGGRITLTCRRVPNRVIVTVEDDGEGIAPENLPQVMTAGFTTKRGGHGLGLHSFAVFLSASNGRLRVESDGKGRGARVIVEMKNE
jgi:signal transduction histidine kinase